MSVKIQRFSNEPIILFRCIGTLNHETEYPQMIEEVRKLKQEMGCHVFRIIDTSTAKLDFGQLVVGMAEDRNREGGMNDPHVTTLIVGSADVIQLAVASAKNQPHYGTANTSLYASVDEALVYARAKIARE